MNNDFHITWIDGGSAAMGWAHICVSREAFSRPEHQWENYLRWWDCGEFTGPETAMLKSALAWVDGILADTSFLEYHVGGEDFDLVQTIGDKENLLSPVRQNAILDWECDKRGIKYFYQSRQLRTNVTSARLHHWGFESPYRKQKIWPKSGIGKDAFAAMQHAVVHLRRLKQRSLDTPWKLNDADVINAYWDCSCRKGRKHNLIHPI